MRTNASQTYTTTLMNLTNNVKQKKPDMKKYIGYDSIYIKYKKRQN